MFTYCYSLLLSLSLFNIVVEVFKVYILKREFEEVEEVEGVL